MTIDEFGKLLTKVKSAIYENSDHKTALIYLHKLLWLVECAADDARLNPTCLISMNAPLIDIRHEAHERGAQILGFIQKLSREEDNT